jgi:dephospho-CoA kinase
MINTTVINIFGPTGSGKSQAAAYLREARGYSVYRLPEIVKQEALKRNKGKELTKDMLFQTGRELGASYAAERTIERVEVDDTTKIVFEGLRQEGELDAIRERYPSVLELYIQSDSFEVRFQRVLKREGLLDQKKIEELEKFMLEEEGFMKPLRQKRGVVMVENNRSLSDYLRSVDEWRNLVESGLHV